MLNSLDGVIGRSVPCSMPMSNVWRYNEVNAGSEDNVKLLFGWLSREECELTVVDVGT